LLRGAPLSSAEGETKPFFTRSVSPPALPQSSAVWQRIASAAAWLPHFPVWYDALPTRPVRAKKSALRNISTQII